MEKIEETKKFRKMLSKIPQKIQNAWKRKRNELTEFLPKPPKFEKFKQYYSLRLPDGFRAHFLKPEKNETTWMAVEIGDHLEGMVNKNKEIGTLNIFSGSILFYGTQILSECRRIEMAATQPFFKSS